jgi:Transmembrane family 220, helix
MGKISNLIFAIIFIAFAALQYNDPDPIVWASIYLYAVLLCIMAYRNKFNGGLYIFGISMYLIYAIYLFFDKNGVINWATVHHGENIAATMKAEQPWIEETREFGGLLMLIIVLLLNYLKGKKLEKAAA